MHVPGQARIPEAGLVKTMRKGSTVRTGPNKTPPSDPCHFRFLLDVNARRGVLGFDRKHPPNFDDEILSVFVQNLDSDPASQYSPLAR